MKKPDILLPPNLVSLSRILVTPLIGYLLSRNDPRSTIWCGVLLIAAAATDGLDGYLARRLGMITQLGLFLDPLADKLFAGVLVLELVAFRNLPVWLAALIIGRDLIILLLGLLIVKSRQFTTPSNITGQYTFFAIVLLIGFYVVRFQFGISLLTVITILLIALSTLSYGYRMIRIMSGHAVVPFRDRNAYKALRVGATILVLGVCFVKLLLLWLD